MPDASAKRNGAKWLLVVLLAIALFGAMFIAGYFTNLYKRNYSDNTNSPTQVNGNH